MLRSFAILSAYRTGTPNDSKILQTSDLPLPIPPVAGVAYGIKYGKRKPDLSEGDLLDLKAHLFEQFNASSEEGERA